MSVLWDHCLGFSRLGLFFLITFSSILPAQGVFDSIGREVHEVFERVKGSVVKIKSDNGVMTLTGSGFFVDGEGTILTSSLVIADENATSVETQEGRWDAKVIGKDARSGLALLKIYGARSKPLPFTDSNLLKVGSAVIGVGYPYNLPVAQSFGLVGGFDFQYLNKFFPTTHIRASLPISPGQVGGPLVNSKGEVMGVLVMSAEEGRSCYALPTSAIQRILKELVSAGKVAHGWVGIGVAEFHDADLAKGVIVSNLFENTPALTSGVQVGDRILKIGDREIRRPSDVIDVSYFSRVGEDLSVLVSRQGKVLSYKIRVQERPATLPAIYRKESQGSSDSVIHVNQK